MVTESEDAAEQAETWSSTSEQFNNESVYDDGQRDENAENHHSIRQTEQQVGAVWGRSLDQIR